MSLFAFTSLSSAALNILPGVALGVLLSAAIRAALRIAPWRRGAQAAQVQQLLDRLSVATRAAGLCVWEMDAVSGEIVWAGNRLKAFGLDELPADQYGPAMLALIEPQDRAALNAEVRRALAEGRETCSHRFQITREGVTRHIQTFAHIVRDEHGKAVRLVGATSDVTNEVQTMELLQRQAVHERDLLERLRLSTEAAGISSWEVDLDTRRFVIAEGRIEALQGVVRSSGATDEFFACLHPDDRAMFLQHVCESVKRRRDRFSCRCRVPAPDGRLIHVQTHVRVIFDATGWARRLLGVSWDITKEIEAAEQLQQQAQQLRDAERRLERASRSSFEGHWESDLVNRRLWCSSSYHALLGYGDGELPQTIDEFLTLVHPEDLDALRATMGAHMQTGAPFQIDVRLRTKSGEYRWFRQRGMGERAEGLTASMAGSVQDVHEQKLAQSALQIAQQRFERAIHGTQDGLWELEHDGAAWCSPRLGELLGYAPDELPSDTNFLREFLHPEDADAVAAATQAHFQQCAAYDVEIRLRTKSGEYRWYRARASAARDAGGRPLRLSGSLQDVTDARCAREALLHATEAAETANRAKSEFLANVSHEIRTPLNGVIGMTGLLLDTALDRTQRDYAETIRSSADSLLSVMNDILDFSKIEAGKLDIESLEFDLHNVVEDVSAMMAFQAAAKNLELVVHIHPDAPARVLGDPQRVRQCLVNLLGNAIKFTRAGEIVVEVRTAGVRAGRVLTQFEVRDTGIGVAPAMLKSLFEPFVQADSSTTRRFGGAGLGLSIVRRLTEMMGGEVGATSELGKGSCFWFTLPFAAAETAQGSAELELLRLGRRVLVIDDNETNRRVLAGQLMRAGYEVSLAAGGVEAITLMRQACVDAQPFDVVLADYRLHDMEGAVLGERIQADPQLSGSRMIVLASTDRQGDQHRFAALGFAAYLIKPVRTRELLDCMDRVLARDAKTWHLQSQPIVTRSALLAHEGARRFRCRVLLVEDNAVNQKVAVRFLERMGCFVRVADNGAEGVKAFTETSFDIVLMDLQMPVMDGLTAAQRIREHEKDGRRTPIIALTANAVGVLERCLAAGMDGFLSKPIEIVRLQETLERYGLSAAPQTTAAAASPAAMAAPVQLARLNELTDGDPEFAYELAVTFIASGEQVLDEIRAASSVYDRTALSRAAHKLKGASANIHAEALRDLAWRLETQAPNLDQRSLGELIQALQQQFDQTAQFLREHAPEPAKKAV